MPGQDIPAAPTTAVLPPTPASSAPALAGAVLDVATTVLRCGFAVMTTAAVTDTVLALTAGGPVSTLAEGLVLIAIAVTGMLRTEAAGRLLRPTGRVTLIAALFVAWGAFDGGVQTHFAQVVPALMWIAAVVSAPGWLVACALVSGVGYVADLAVQGHSLHWMLHGDGLGVIATQEADVLVNGAVGLLAVRVLRRFLQGVSADLGAVRASGPSLTPQLAAAVRGTPRTLPRATPAAVVEDLTDAEHEVIALLAAGRVPKQAARDLGVTLPTVRSHIAAAKRKTGARTLVQLVALVAEAGVVRA